MFAITKLPYSTYQELIEASTPLKVRHNRPYVLLNSTGLIIKHFYKRGWWSSSTLWPYPLRFHRNCKRLAQRGWTVPEPQHIYDIPEKNCFIVTYPHITGKTIREQSLKNDFSLLEKFPALIAKLHQQGIYFRDLHTDNIVEQPNHSFALIDVVGIKIFNKPLSLTRRAHNLAHLFTVETELNLLKAYGIEKFLNAYFNCSQLSINQQKKIVSHLKTVTKESLFSLSP